MDFRELQGTSIISAIILLATVLTALAGITKTGRRFCLWSWKWLRKLYVYGELQEQRKMIVELQRALDDHKLGLNSSLERLTTLMEHQSQKIDTLVHEIQVNGGSSLRDVLNHLFIEQMAEAASRRAMFTDAIAFFEADTDGKFIFVSDRLAEVLDLNPHDALGDGWITAIHPDDVDRVTKSWHFAVKQKRAFVESFRFWNRITSEKIVQIHCHPATGPRRQVAKYIGLVTLK